jgi:hypothetical protein
MANVQFIIRSTDSIWTRDYGPQFVFDANGDQGIVDPQRDRSTMTLLYELPLGTVRETPPL